MPARACHLKMFLRSVWLACCLCALSADAAIVLHNRTFIEVDSTLTASICESNTSSRLTFVTSLSIRGCALFVHRLGEVKTGRFVLEPVFCITSPDAMRRPSAHYDLLTKESYFSFPVNVTDELLLPDVESQLQQWQPKSVSFLEVTSIRLSHTKSVAFRSAAFLWGPTESVGHVRMECDGFSCQSLALYLSKGQVEAFESLSLEATMQVGEGCGPLTRTYPVTIAHAPFLNVTALQRPRDDDLPSCSDLRLFKVVQLDNCTAYVHQSQSKKGRFVIEPLLCPTANFSLLTDHSLGRHYLKLPAIVEDSAILSTVKSCIAYFSPQSVEFMKLWDARILVTDKLSQWEIQAVRLSVDRKAAELRVYCGSQPSCELLGSVLSSEPVNFWKNIQWTVTSVLDDKCEFKSDKRRFAFRMKEREPDAASRWQTGGRWSLEALHNRTVTRGGRQFIVVQQRGCNSRTSNFQRTWAEYVEGFGDDSNFWIGLDVLRSLTSAQDTTMRVEMLLWNDTEWFAEYSGFSVGNLSTKYVMKYNEMVRSRSSLVYDAMSGSKGYAFSTRDVDNDIHSSLHCSVNWGGYSGWWYSNCGNANPNGVYNFGDTTGTSSSVWMFVESLKALKEFRMMIQI